MRSANENSSLRYEYKNREAAADTPICMYIAADREWVFHSLADIFDRDLLQCHEMVVFKGSGSSSERSPSKHLNYF